MSRLTDARSELERYEQTKPADYQSKYQGQIKDVMGQIDGMGDYDYDPAADTAYQQYKSQYTRSAKLANQNRRMPAHGPAATAPATAPRRARRPMH